ncbi:MAG: hypothetical protein U5Q03_08910 [Bacteroidota bacterium]|nr:hypothetical protein [Bacteroidota bacterium]
MIYPTLKASKNEFSNPDFQLDILEAPYKGQVRFRDKLKKIGMYPLKPFEIKIFQVNIGKMCNQTCMHCHVDAGPDRTEIMTRENMQHCLEVIRNHSFESIDLTGGLPNCTPILNGLCRRSGASAGMLKLLYGQT